MKDRIRLIIKTLQEIQIPATFDNCRKMAGCLEALDNIYGELVEEEQIKADEERNKTPPEPEE